MPICSRTAAPRRPSWLPPLARTVLSIRDRLPYLREIIVVGASAEDRAELRDVLLFEDLLGDAEPKPFTAATMSDEVAFWMYTSGSTGDPKAVKHVHTSLMATREAHGPRHHRHPRG